MQGEKGSFHITYFYVKWRTGTVYERKAHPAGVRTKAVVYRLNLRIYYQKFRCHGRKSLYGVTAICRDSASLKIAWKKIIRHKEP